MVETELIENESEWLEYFNDRDIDGSLDDFDGVKVDCLNTGDYKNITKGQTYTIGELYFETERNTDEIGDEYNMIVEVYIYIINNEDKRTKYNIKYFKFKEPYKYECVGCNIKILRGIKFEDEMYCNQCIKELEIGSCSCCYNYKRDVKQRLPTDRAKLCADCEKTFKIRKCECCHKFKYDDLSFERNQNICKRCFEQRFNISTKILNKRNPPIKWFTEGGAISKNNLGRTFGIEFEVNTKDFMIKSFQAFKHDINKITYMGMPISQFLLIKGDGSLDYEKGVEFNTVILEENTGLEILKLVVPIMQKHFAVDRKCGLHLHIGIPDFDNEHISSLYYFYQRFQTYMRYYIDDSRLHNQYCKALRRLPKERIKQTMYDRLTYDRYSNVNFKAIDEFGTIEFRNMEGTLDYPKIENWVKTHLRIINYISKSKDELINAKRWSMEKQLKGMLGKELYTEFKSKESQWRLKHLKIDGKQTEKVN